MNEFAINVDELAVVSQNGCKAGLIVVEHPTERRGGPSRGGGKVHARSLCGVDGSTSMWCNDVLAGPRKGVIKVRKDEFYHTVPQSARAELHTGLAPRV